MVGKLKEQMTKGLWFIVLCATKCLWMILYAIGNMNEIRMQDLNKSEPTRCNPTIQRKKWLLGSREVINSRL